MRFIIYIVILLSLFLAPVERTDVAKLLPIQAVAVYIEDGEVVLETDTEHKGDGADAEKALDSLRINTPAVVYLDTAEYLLVSKEAVSDVDPLRQYLKPTVKVCVCDAADNVKDAAKYLDVHGNLPQLRHWSAADYMTKYDKK